MSALLAFVGLSVLAALALLIFGRRPERAAGLAVLLYLLATPAMQSIAIEGWRLGIAVLELALFLCFWLMAERWNRWWLTAAAGFQLILVLSFVVVLIIPDTYVWSGVVARYAAWCLVLVSMIGGLWEARVFSTSGLPTSPGYPP